MTKLADRIPRTPLLQVFAAILVMGACGGGGDDNGAAASKSTSGSAQNMSSVTDGSGASDSTAAAWAEDKCSIVSADDVGAAVGEPVSARDYPPFGCQYTGTDPVSRTAVVIDYFSISFECELVESRTPDAEVVEGLGVHAVNGMAGIGAVLAVTLDDDHCFFVYGQDRAVAEAVLASLGASSGGSSEIAVEAPSTATAPDTANSSTADSSAETTGPETIITAPDTTDAASPNSSGDPCRWLTAEEAEAALGVVVRPPVRTEIPDSAYGPGADCAYNSVDEPAGPASVHVAILGTRFPRDLWDQAQRAEGFAPVAGVGELAYFDGNSKLEVFDQGRWIQVQIVNPQVMAGDGLIPLLSDLARNAIERF